MVSITLTEKSDKTPVGTSSKFLDQLHGKGYYAFFPSESWTPNVNLYETQSMYYVCVDLAGVEKDKIDIEVVESRLTLRGHRTVPSPPNKDDGGTHTPRIRMHLMEIDHGQFTRFVELPENVEQDQIKARYEDGILWIELPKKR